MESLQITERRARAEGPDGAKAGRGPAADAGWGGGGEGARTPAQAQADSRCCLSWAR